MEKRCGKLKLVFCANCEFFTLQKLAKLIDFLVFRNNVIYHKCTCCPLPWSPFFINTAHTIAKICCRGYQRGCLILFCLTLILVSRFNFTSRWQATSILQIFYLSLIVTWWYSSCVLWMSVYFLLKFLMKDEKTSKM